MAIITFLERGEGPTSTFQNHSLWWLTLLIHLMDTHNFHFQTSLLFVQIKHTSATNLF